MNPCLPSVGNEEARLAIFLDYPAVVEDKRNKAWVSVNAEFVKWSLRRMSVDTDLVYFDFILKCYPAMKLPGKKADRLALVAACSCYRYESLKTLQHCKTVVGLGSLAGEVLTGYGKIGEVEGCSWVPIERPLRDLGINVWIGYSPGYALEKPSESQGIYRVLWKAAEEAGLNPVFDPSVKPFPFPE